MPSSPTLLLTFATLIAAGCARGVDAAPPAAGASAAAPTAPRTLTRLDGSPLPAEALQGKAVLYVNVASECGYTGQYAGLQALSERFAARGLVVVGVPCNQFGGQEPGSAEQIQSFCKLNYGVDFPLLEKQDVNGAGRSALYQWLVAADPTAAGDLRWNFEKFLVGPDGAVRGRFPSKVKPDDPALVAAIEAALPGAG
jgi:glutathione peroxidase